MINKIKNSRDYIDICYMIDHVNEIDTLVDILHKLGYRTGYIIIKHDLGAKSISVDKQNNYRIQITPKHKNINIARCVILTKEEIKELKIIK